MIRFEKLTLIFFGVCALLLLKSAFWSSSDVFDIVRVHREIQAQEKVNDVWTRKNQALYRQVVLLKNNPDYLEGIARRQYGLVGPGEKYYAYAIVPGSSAQTSSTATNQ